MATAECRVGHPKIGEAIALLKSAPDQIEADMGRQYPGRSVKEFWRTIGPRQTGEMSPREFVVLVKGFTDESLFKRTKYTAWTVRERLAARIVNVLEAHRGDYRHAHGAEHDWAPVTPPELPHERAAREAQETKAERQRALGPAVLERMLRGELRMSDIDITKPIEEALTA
ncbi:hypothetical protein AB0L97_32995 [Nocardia sp. NPDC051911]|uniref:hypothetical protein n=1 Tax=Nocardia sp. NPDC051911 TaxID=3154648 RepID=UPI003436D7ED